MLWSLIGHLVLLQLCRVVLQLSLVYIKVYSLFIWLLTSITIRLSLDYCYLFLADEKPMFVPRNGDKFDHLPSCRIPLIWVITVMCFCILINLIYSNWRFCYKIKSYSWLWWYWYYKCCSIEYIISAYTSHASLSIILNLVFLFVIWIHLSSSTLARLNLFVF